MPQRTRERGHPNVPTYFAGQSRLLYSNSPTETSNFNGSRLGTYEVMTDYVTPQFARRRNRGEVFNNPLSKSVYRYTGTPGTTIFAENPPTNIGGKLRYGQEYYNLNALVKGPLRPPVDPVQPTGHLLYDWEPTIDENFLMSKAATAALSNSRAKGAQGLVIVAEMRKTLQTLRNPLAATLKALKNRPKILRSDKPALGTLRNAAQGASSQYLTWFYGLRTIMFDIEEIMGALEKPLFDRQTGRSFAKDEYVDESWSMWNAGTGSHNAKVTVRYTESCEVRAGALVLIEAKTTAQRLGFDILKIPESVWELMPWSFVIDWFVNVQDTIGALEAVVSNKFLAEWVVRRRTLTWRRFVSNHVTNPSFPTVALTSPCVDEDQVVVEMYDRIPQDLSKIVGPTLDLSLNKVPTLAAISLVVQQLVKGK